ncbi:MAG: sigma-70 family RNA polymerase sigma factor [Anaerolineales bacterium]
MSTQSKAVDQEIISLVKRAQGGDQDAYTDLFNQFHQPVLGYVYHTLHDRHAAEDVAQDAFIRALDRIDQLGPPWDFKSWIYRIASNLAIDYLRAGKRIVNVEEDVMAYLEDRPSTQHPQERRLSRAEGKKAVWASLDRLTPRYRQALVLHEFNDLSYRQLAQALEISYDNARQIVHRARTEFRDVHGLRVAVERAAQRCQRLGDLLSAYRDQELDPLEADEVRDHLATCEDCQQERDEIDKVAALLAGLMPMIPSPAWKSAVLERIREKHMPPKPEPTVRRTPEGQGEAGSGAGGGGGAAGSGGWLGMTFGGWLPWLFGLSLIVVLSIGGVAVASSRLFDPRATATPLVLDVFPSPGATGSALADMFAEPSSTPTVAETDVPSPSPTSTIQPTLGPPIAKALQDSTCRSGPSKSQFGAAAYVLEGQSVPIEGRDSSDTYWWVVQPDGTGHCYLWKQLAEATGDVESVPFVPDPATPTPPDEEAPQVAVSHMPNAVRRPTTTELVNFNANASDNLAVAQIEIYVQGPNDNSPQLVKTCTSTNSCSYLGGPYPAVKIDYFARANDAAGNQAQSPTHSFTSVATLN